MKKFFDDDILLSSDVAKKLYDSVKDLPVIDYHCHLDQYAIARNDGFDDIGKLWLGGDHYKWRAMRMCGVDEKYITGDASYAEKFAAYASIMPELVGNPLYYWSHLELKQLFGITEPLDKDSASRIYKAANEKLRGMKVRDMLKFFNVEFVATTDDPAGDLSAHGVYDGITVAPTFRPDKVCSDPTPEYLDRLGSAAGKRIKTLDDLLSALSLRLDEFVDRGCVIADHGFLAFPKSYACYDEAAAVFENYDGASAEKKDAFFGFILDWLAREYHKRGILMQLHFSVTRNVNPSLYASLGADCGCDVIADEVCANGVIKFLARLDGERPEILLYSLNPNAIPMLASISGAFRGVRMGAAWWFNDTAAGIRENLSRISEYACLGTHTGMLTDSRSFSSYSRFDFFRRILCDYVGSLVESGACDMKAALRLVGDVSYHNIKKQIIKRH